MGKEVQDDFSKGLAAVDQGGDTWCLADGGGLFSLDDGARDVVASVVFGREGGGGEDEICVLFEMVRRKDKREQGEREEVNIGEVRSPFFLPLAPPRPHPPPYVLVFRPRPEQGVVAHLAHPSDRVLEQRHG